MPLMLRNVRARGFLGAPRTLSIPPLRPPASSPDRCCRSPRPSSQREPHSRRRSWKFRPVIPARRHAPLRATPSSRCPLLHRLRFQRHEPTADSYRPVQPDPTVRSKARRRRPVSSSYSLRRRRSGRTPSRGSSTPSRRLSAMVDSVHW